MTDSKVYNPENKPVDDLPWVYGFPNSNVIQFNSLGGSALSQDGVFLHIHVSSNEDWLRHDLGMIEGGNPNAQAHFAEHYPGGYRTRFMSFEEARADPDVAAALKTATASSISPEQ